MTKKVLVTGGAGFIGHHIIEYLLDNTDWSIVSLDRLDISGNLNRLSDIMTNRPQQDRQRLSIQFHDLKSEINQSLSARVGSVDIILHLAASSHVDRSIDNPVGFVLDNVLGTAHVLDYARTCKNLEKFIFFSTDEVFGPAPPGVFFHERDRYNCTNPYSATKAGAEELCVAFENTYHLPITILHVMNVFGARQHSEKFIPLCIKKLLRNETIHIHSDHTKVRAGSRHYIHATDVASAVFKILGHQQIDPIDAYGIATCPKINLAGAEEIDNFKLAQKIASIINQPLNFELVDYHSSRPGHDLRYALDRTLISSLGWQPHSVSERLEETVKWYLEHQDWLL